jgi:hypothetical protein
MSEYLGCLGLDVLISMARWDFWVRVWRKNYIDQEHEILFGDCVNNVVLRLLSEMDIWKMVWFLKNKKIYLMGSWEI